MALQNKRSTVVLVVDRHSIGCRARVRPFREVCFHAPHTDSAIVTAAGQQRFAGIKLDAVDFIGVTSKPLKRSVAIDATHWCRLLQLVLWGDV